MLEAGTDRGEGEKGGHQCIHDFYEFVRYGHEGVAWGLYFASLQHCAVARCLGR